jgi:phospholipid/cholesterol/gamma-HCH transport system ATP-binding protein
MIEIVDLHKAFGTKKVLRGVDLKIEKGENMVVIGGSGSGKSVLIKHITRILKPDSGSVYIDNVDICCLGEKELYKIRRRFGMLFQNVGFALMRDRKYTDQQVREIVSEKLKLVGLAGVEELMPSELSGGMRKRVGLARAIAYDPDLILYDEPTTGLDPIMADAINDLLLEMHEKLDVTSVTITHDMHSAYKIADRIAMLYDGRIIETGTPDEIKHSKNPIVQQFITGSATGPIKVKEMHS